MLQSRLFHQSQRFPRALLTAFAAAALIAAVISAAFAAAADADSGGQSPAGCTPPVKPAFTMLVSSSGVMRTAQIHVAKNAPAGVELPVVLAFHGAGGNGRGMAEGTQLSALADEMNFIAVYPNAASSNRFWTLSDHAGAPNDVQFVSDLLDRLEATLCVDRSRIYATGVSNGGGMTARVGCELSGRLAAIAPVAGGYKSLPPCNATRPISVLELHGTSDTVVPYNGIAPAFAGSVPAYLDGWVKRDGCRATPARRGVARRVIVKDWSGCAPNVAVEHLEFYGVGHEWPETIGAKGDPTTQWIWHFLSSKSAAPQ